MATYSSILVWEISWTKEAWWAIVHGLQRVRHNLVTKHQQQTSVKCNNTDESHPQNVAQKMPNIKNTALRTPLT